MPVMLKYQLIFLAINKLLINGEWIEMPQFSDDSKVYKLSSQRYDDKFSIDNYQESLPDYNDESKITELLNEFGNEDRNISRGEILSHETKDSSDLGSDNGDDSFSTNSDLREILSIEAEISTPATPLTLELPTEEPSASSTVIPLLPVKKYDETPPPNREKEKFINETMENAEFQDYLPMEMLKKVHRTLKAQPSSLKGKVRFLKQFEKDLVTEIEKRLSTALAPLRRTRGARDYHDHDDELGFPSLEGALMAISFLTFAVYLVRLVMLLFRIPNNTTSATVLFGRQRRSTNTLNYKTEEILHYLDNFDTD